MSEKLRAVQVGLGSRGIIHINGMLHNGADFEVVGYCNRSEANLQASKQLRSGIFWI